MLTPTRPLLIGQLPSALHPIFHFVSLFHFRARVCPEPPIPRRPFPFGTVASGPSLRAIVYGGRRGLGGSAKWTGASRPLAPLAVWQCMDVPDWSSLVCPRPWPRPTPRFSVCVAYRGGVSSEWSPPPASAAAASRGLPESLAGGESGCGLVFTVIVASPRLGGLRSGLLLPRERGFTAITRSLPGLPTHSRLVRVE